MKNVHRSSTFIDKIETSLRRGKATVYLKDGNIYSYSNVSRRAILNLFINQNLSLGFWFNKNCSNSDRAILNNQSFETPWLNETQLADFLEPSEEELRDIELEQLEERHAYNQELIDELNEEYATANAW
tara:strand:- start:191 stop:577 length:387 start_codon:yes stop_codon:yes gene_type:complete